MEILNKSIFFFFYFWLGKILLVREVLLKFCRINENIWKNCIRKKMCHKNEKQNHNGRGKEIKRKPTNEKSFKIRLLPPCSSSMTSVFTPTWWLYKKRKNNMQKKSAIAMPPDMKMTLVVDDRTVFFVFKLHLWRRNFEETPNSVDQRFDLENTSDSAEAITKLYGEKDFNFQSVIFFFLLQRIIWIFALNEESQG